MALFSCSKSSICFPVTVHVERMHNLGEIWISFLRFASSWAFDFGQVVPTHWIGRELINDFKAAWKKEKKKIILFPWNNKWPYLSATATLEQCIAIWWKTETQLDAEAACFNAGTPFLPSKSHSPYMKHNLWYPALMLELWLKKLYHWKSILVKCCNKKTFEHSHPWNSNGTF